MQARWLVGGALFVLATSVAAAQPGATPPPSQAAPVVGPLPAPVVGQPDANADTGDTSDATDTADAQPLPTPKPQTRSAAPSPLPAAYPAPPPAAYPAYPRPGDWQPGAPMVLPAAERTADYRVQLVLADLAGFAAIGIAEERGALLALANYVVTPMLIHNAHDEGMRVAASAGLRLGLPLLGGLLGALRRDASYCVNSAYDGTDGDYYTDDCDDGPIVFGAALGVLAAIVIDDGFLGRSHRIDKPRPSWSPRISVAPTRDHQVGQIDLGVAGQF